MKRILLVVGFTFLFSGCLLGSSVNFSIGRNYYEKNDFKNAEIYFMKALNENKDDEAYYHLGVLYARQEKFELAEKYYKLAVENGYPGAYNNLGVLYENQKKYDLAEKFYKLGIENEISYAIRNLALLYDKQKNLTLLKNIIN